MWFDTDVPVEKGNFAVLAEFMKLVYAEAGLLPLGKVRRYERMVLAACEWSTFDEVDQRLAAIAAEGKLEGLVLDLSPPQTYWEEADLDLWGVAGDDLEVCGGTWLAVVGTSLCDLAHALKGLTVVCPSDQTAATLENVGYKLIRPARTVADLMGNAPVYLSSEFVARVAGSKEAMDALSKAFPNTCIMPGGAVEQVALAKAQGC